MSRCQALDMALEDVAEGAGGSFRLPAWTPGS